MDAALGLVRAGPAAGAVVLAGGDGPRAGPAADAGITPVVERVVGDLVLHDEAPDILLGPRRERIELDEAELAVALDDGGVRPVWGLVAPDGADPCVEADEGLLERDDFADV